MPKRPRKFKSFWIIVRHILADFPAAQPVIVRVAAPLRHYGYTTKNEAGQFVVVIRALFPEDSDLAYVSMLDTFIHEYAHVLNWSNLQDAKPEQARWHDETWGAWYSRLYRYLHEET